MKINKVFKCTQEQFDNYKTREKVPLECIKCKCTYYRIKRYIVNHVRDFNRYPTLCNNKECRDTLLKISNVICNNCKNSFQIKKKKKK